MQHPKRRTSLPPPAALAALAALAAPARAQDADAEAWAVDAARVERLGGRAIELVEEELGVELADRVTIRVASVADVEAALSRELEPQFRAQFSDPEAAVRERERFAESFAEACLAKFAWSSDEILVVPENFRKLSGLWEEPELSTDGALAAVLAHEVVHAADDAHHPFEELVARATDYDSLQAVSALVEGHAQHVARRLAAANGWTEGFETYTRGVSKDVTTDATDPTIRLIVRAQILERSFAYRRGEEFVAALDAEGGREAIEAAFASPPTSTELVIHPDWYLDPGSRPESRVDFDGALAVVAAEFDEETWMRNRRTLTSEQIALQIELLEDEDVERFTRTMRSNRVLVLNPEDAPASKVVVAALYEFATPGDAAWFVAASERIMREKDELAAEGFLEIVSANYESLVLDSGVGVWATKELEVQEEEVLVMTVVLASGDLALEFLLSNEPWEKERVIEVAARALAAAPAPPEVEREPEGEAAGGSDGER